MSSVPGVTNVKIYRNTNKQWFVGVMVPILYPYQKTLIGRFGLRYLFTTMCVLNLGLDQQKTIQKGKSEIKKKKKKNKKRKKRTKTKRKKKENKK